MTRIVCLDCGATVHRVVADSPVGIEYVATHVGCRRRAPCTDPAVYAIPHPGCRRIEPAPALD